MATQYTTRAALQFWQLNDPDWHLPYAATCQALDALAPVGGLAVTPADRPSATLNVRVGPGSYRTPAGIAVAFAGSSSVAVPGSATTYLWLDAVSGALATGTGWPVSPHVRLAVVAAGPSAITSIADARVAFGTTSGGGSWYSTASISADFTASAADDLIRVDGTAVPVAVTLPSSGVPIGKPIILKRVDASANAVVTAGAAVDGASSKSLGARASMTVCFNGSGWDILSAYGTIT